MEHWVAGKGPLTPLRLRRGRRTNGNDDTQPARQLLCAYDWLSQSMQFVCTVGLVTCALHAMAAVFPVAPLAVCRAMWCVDTAVATLFLLPTRKMTC